MSLQQWYDVSGNETHVLPFKLTKKGFSKMLNRMHSESKLNSEAVRSNDRLWYYKFERSSLILDEKRLRNRSLPIDKLETENRTDFQSIFLPSEEVEEDNNESGLDLLSSLTTGILQTTTTPSPTEVPTPTTMPPSTTEVPTIPVRDIFNLKTKQYIELTQQLDFALLVRPNLKFPSFPNITIHKSKSLTEGLKWHFICLYNEYTRGEDYLMTYKEKIIVMNAIIKNESYHNGYSKPVVSIRTFQRFIEKYRKEQKTDSVSNTFVSKKGHGKDSYIGKLEKQFPKYLHKLYRYSSKILGIDATVPQYIYCMNTRSKILHPNCPIRSDLGLSIHHFWVFFYANGGQLKRPTTKPSLTDEQKRARVQWAKEMQKTLLEMEDFFYCFLDEKWFYTTSRRNKMKILPKADWESDEEAKLTVPKVHSRRHTTKVMLLGIIGPPVYHKNEIDPVSKKKKVLFDGKIMIKRVSERVKLSRMVTNQVFVEDHLLNDDIKTGEWKELLSDSMDMSINEALIIISNHYNIDNDIADCLCFTYYDWQLKTKQKPKPV